ncbi:asparagine synthase (glutamine-hydrolyzing) [Rubidibacter lacunae KORDI 51-2]|uniref:asparagine synthase (glutamine-hydrolyzing) n=1 Tax=Rubidibacter lacunae KORDI 51-2 TaxID=582515 RepID=U5D7T7_9CHRO|nr:albusnodin/ikarugamycin family macrolactam cyclase [Rubidibacter lacunae]ERN40678.1 asparagine synthase (glutamine-hydrolyzing) [Rubidibacter lacunae KORDI 51-2]
MKRWFCGSVKGNEENNNLELLEPLKGKSIWTGLSSFWLCGSWQEQQYISLTEGSVKVVFVGTCLSSRENLVRKLKAAKQLRNYSLLMQLPGNYNLIVQSGEDTYIFVDAMGVRLIFYASWNSSIIYSSISLSLQKLIKAEVDLQWLATSLAGISTLSLSKIRSPFKNIKLIPPGNYLHITPTNSKLKKYWVTISGYKPFAESANALQECLLKSVEGRASLYGNASSDLSGGFDSTTIAMIAAKMLNKKGKKFYTVTEKTHSAIRSSDIRYAEDAANLYPNIEALMLCKENIPLEYGSLNLIPFTDFPNPALAYCMGGLDYVMKAIRSINSQVHMSGEGGDAVLMSVGYSYLIDLMRKASFSRFFLHLAGWCRVHSLSLLGLLSLVVKRSILSYPNWLQKVKRLEFSDLKLNQRSKSFRMAWDILPTIASWHSDQLGEQVIAELQDLTEIAVPFSGSMGEHLTISLIQLNAISARTIQQVADLYDVNLEYPYFDRLVVEACLSARPYERTSPISYKPLLVEAFKDILPPSIYVRNTKGEYVADEFIGFKANLNGINSSLENSQLVRLGLVDASKLRAAMQNFVMGLGDELALFSPTLATEAWLRCLNESRHEFWNFRNSR